MRYGTKWHQYASWWDAMTILPKRQQEFDGIAKKILANKTRYQTIEQSTEVPWWLVAVLHMRESDGNFDTYLGNGQNLHQVTTIVPKGRGPFASFEAGAEDSLKLDGLTDVKDWRLEKALYYAEIYNGTGYNDKGLPSPYIFGGTNIQKPGKYIGDHKFNGRVWDTQPGVAPIMATLAKMDNTIQFVRES